MDSIADTIRARLAERRQRRAAIQQEATAAAAFVQAANDQLLALAGGIQELEELLSELEQVTPPEAPPMEPAPPALAEPEQVEPAEA